MRRRFCLFRLASVVDELVSRSQIIHSTRSSIGFNIPQLADGSEPLAGWRRGRQTMSHNLSLRERAQRIRLAKKSVLLTQLR